MYVYDDDDDDGDGDDKDDKDDMIKIDLVSGRLRVA
jgi:hypothetical protein